MPAREERPSARHGGGRALPRPAPLLLQVPPGEKSGAKRPGLVRIRRRQACGPGPICRPCQLPDRRSWRASGKGMLEAQIREYRPLSATAADAERECEAGDDLKAGRKIDCAAQSGREQELGAPLRLTRARNILRGSPRTLEHHVEFRVGKPDYALTQRVAPRCGRVAEGVPRARRVSHTGVGMCYEVAGKLRAERQVDLKARPA